MNNAISHGCWPVMLTPFCENGSIDWQGLDALVEWYIDAGVAGLFAVCLSSEMHLLSPEERIQVASRVVNRAGGRVPVVAAGAFGETSEQQAAAARRIAETGVQAVVLTVNQMAGRQDDDLTWDRNAEAIFRACGGIPLGLYECPQPYDRKLSPTQLAWAAQTGQVSFLKDTCCQRRGIKTKLQAAKGTPLNWFNAHCPTLLYSLRAGGHGYSGIAANFYPHLFVRLCHRFREAPEEADRLQRFLTLADLTIRTRYPASAKRYLKLIGLPIGPTCRVDVPARRADDDEDLVLANLHEMVKETQQEWPII